MGLTNKDAKNLVFTDKTTFKDIIEFALEKERTAYNFFSNASQQVRSPGVQVMFRELAEEERSHIEWLQEPLNEEELLQKDLQGVDIPDMELDKFIIEKEVTPETTAQEALAIAIHWEERARDFYEKAIHLVKEPLLQEVFKKLANFELQHKLKLEREYDNWVYREN